MGGEINDRINIFSRTHHAMSRVFNEKIINIFSRTHHAMIRVFNEKSEISRKTKITVHKTFF